VHNKTKNTDDRHKNNNKTVKTTLAFSAADIITAKKCLTSHPLPTTLKRLLLLKKQRRQLKLRKLKLNHPTGTFP